MLLTVLGGKKDTVGDRGQVRWGNVTQKTPINIKYYIASAPLLLTARSEGDVLVCNLLRTSCTLCVWHINQQFSQPVKTLLKTHNKISHIAADTAIINQSFSLFFPCYWQINFGRWWEWCVMAGHAMCHGRALHLNAPDSELVLLTPSVMSQLNLSCIFCKL